MAEDYLDDPDGFFMKGIPGYLVEKPEVAAKVGSVHEVAVIELAGERGGTWHFVLGDGQVAIDRGDHPKPSFTIAMSVETFRGLREGKVGIPGAVLRRKIRTRGSLRALLRVGALFRDDKKKGTP
jgi:putative sterol carrier protein